VRNDPGVSTDPPVFFFAAMSTYSWISAERIAAVLPSARWKPVTAAFIFKAAGRTPWGLTDRREAGIADCEERARRLGLGDISWPQPWPTSDIPVARAMTYADSIGRLRPYALSAMRLAFREGANLELVETLLEAARRCGIDERELASGIEDPAIKDRLRETTDEASALGVFGIPTVIVAGDLFWGDDRLDEAARAHARRIGD
jgi:2-hydroxychromene-2-carboxylate isomerase